MKWSPLYLRTRTGYLICITRRTEVRTYERMFVEDLLPLAAIWRSSERKSPVVFDVGACFGYFSLSVMDYYPDAKVHLFEANPKLISVIDHHRKINSCTNWTVNHGAVACTSGEVNLFLSSSPLAASLDPKKAAEFKAKGSILVPGINLDDYVNEKSIDYIDIMKLDVEGCEEQIIVSSPKTFSLVEVLYIRIFPGFSQRKRVSELLIQHDLHLAEGATYDCGEHLYVRKTKIAGA